MSSSIHVKEQEYLHGLLSSVKLDEERFKIYWMGEDKYIMGISSHESDDKFAKNSKYLALYTSVYEINYLINYSFEQALNLWYNTSLYLDFNSISNNKSDNERLLYYFMENGILRVSILWDLLSHFYNIYYDMNIKEKNVHYKKMICMNKDNKIKAIDNYDDFINEIKILKEYIEEDYNESKNDDGVWKGNHKYISDIRNQLSHRNAPSVTGVLGNNFHIKIIPNLTLKRAIEDYYLIIKEIDKFTERIETEFWELLE